MILSLLSSCFSTCSPDSRGIRSPGSSHPTKLALTQYETNTFSSEVKKSHPMNEIFVIEKKDCAIMAYLTEIDFTASKEKDSSLGICLLYDPMKGNSILVEKILANNDAVLEILRSSKENETQTGLEAILIDEWAALERFRSIDHLFYNTITENEQFGLETTDDLIENIKELMNLNQQFSLIMPLSQDLDALASIFHPLFSERKVTSTSCILIQKLLMDSEPLGFLVTIGSEILEVSPQAQISYLLRSLSTSNPSIPSLLFRVGLQKSLDCLRLTQKSLKNCNPPALLSHFLKTLHSQSLIDPSELPLLSPYFSHVEQNSVSYNEIMAFSPDGSSVYNPSFDYEQFSQAIRKIKKPKIQVKPYKLKDLKSVQTPANSHQSRILIKNSSNTSFQKSGEFSKYSPNSLESSINLQGVDENYGEKTSKKEEKDRSYVKIGKGVSSRNSF